jgi:hypothetical protein
VEEDGGAEEEVDEDASVVEAEDKELEAEETGAEELTLVLDTEPRVSATSMWIPATLKPASTPTAELLISGSTLTGGPEVSVSVSTSTVAARSARRIAEDVG